MREVIIQSAVSLAEAGRVSDPLLRWGMRRVVSSRLAREDAHNPGTDAVADRLSQGPIVVSAGLANKQHYEVPAAFFESVLGPRLKYSSGWWEAATDLGRAEEAMLELTAERAGLADGHRILDLGCGWGSFALWAAMTFPRSNVVAVSNSVNQGDYIRGRAERSGLDNLSVVTADIASYEPVDTFDRIVSVEMLEHVRNHQAVFGKAAGWLHSNGAMFVHVFAHRRHAYTYETDGPGDWMAHRFFSGGVMPSRELLPIQARAAWTLSGQWSISGVHYRQTLEAWLERLDANRSQAAEALAMAGVGDVDREIQAWRMFFLACSELFGFREGTEWGIEHYVFRPRP